MHRDSVLVINNAINVSHLDVLNARMVPEAETLYAEASTHHNFGTGKGNIQQDAVVDNDFIFEDVIANPFATAACSVPRPVYDSKARIQPSRQRRDSQHM